MSLDWYFVVALLTLLAGLSWIIWNGNRKEKPEPRLAFRRGQTIIVEGSVEMKAGTSERFQLVVVDKFGNAVSGVKLSNVTVTGDPSVVGIVDGTTDESQFDLVSKGPAGNVALSASAVAMLADGKTTINLSASLSAAIDPADAALMTLKDVGPTPAS